jgi:hypothetical protein
MLVSFQNIKLLGMFLDKTTTHPQAWMGKNVFAEYTTETVSQIAVHFPKNITLQLPTTPDYTSWIVAIVLLVVFAMILAIGFGAYCFIKLQKCKNEILTSNSDTSDLQDTESDKKENVKQTEPPKYNELLTPPNSDTSDLQRQTEPPKYDEITVYESLKKDSEKASRRSSADSAILV